MSINYYDSCRTFALGLAAATLLSGCSSDDNSSDTSTMPAPGTAPEDTVTLEGLDGNWAKACMAHATDATYSTATLVAADNVVTITDSVFTDSGCVTPASPATIESQRSLVFDGTTSNTSLGDASHVTWTVESKTINGVQDTASTNESAFDLMLITNNTLYFGDRSGANDGSTEALRPSTLDETAIFTLSE